MAKSIQIPPGRQYTFTFDGAEDVLVVKFANKQDITMDVVTFENLEVFEILENGRYFMEGVRKHGYLQGC